MATLALEAGIGALDVIYVTRAYATRHGAGPFPREVDASYPDATNVPNSWQGTLRFGELDLDLLHEAVAADVAVSPLPVLHRLAVTCLDQVGEAVRFWQGGSSRTAAPAAMLDTAQALLGSGLIASYGPTRDTLGVGRRLGRRQRHAA